MAKVLAFSALLLLLACLWNAAEGDGGLSSGFYDKSCPSALSSIRSEIRKGIAKERRMAASILRLHFHDCFVQGCDASLLLDDSPSIESEKGALPNLNSLRGFDLIDDAKALVERECPGVVSCADILAVAARDASEYVGGPTWKVKLGRRDTTSASRSRANDELPSFLESLSALTSRFAGKGLSERDLVALSGAHTIGRSRCVIFRDRIYNASNTTIDANFAKTRKGRCPAAAGDGDSNLAPLDLVTPDSFDTNYFKNLMLKKGLLPSDQVLFSGGPTDEIVTEYSKSKEAFYRDFAAAMIRMGDIGVLTGSAGQVRTNCRLVN